MTEPRCTPGHHFGEAVPIADPNPDEPYTHACFECCQLFDAESIAWWEELERLSTGSGPPATGI